MRLSHDELVLGSLRSLVDRVSAVRGRKSPLRFIELARDPVASLSLALAVIGRTSRLLCRRSNDDGFDWAGLSCVDITADMDG